MEKNIEKDTVRQFVSAQLKTWKGRTKERAAQMRRPVVALSMEPGSNGWKSVYELPIMGPFQKG